MLASNTCNMVIKDAGGINVLTNFMRTLTSAATVDSIACYALNPGANGNLYFNQFSVTSTSSVAPVTLSSPAYSGTSVSFSFQTQSGHAYTVLYKNLLTDPIWLTNTVLAGTDSITNVIDSITNSPSRFYRVRAQ
jgi:hypothetical protein